MRKIDFFSIEEQEIHPLVEFSFLSRTVKEHSYKIMESLGLFDISNTTINDQCFGIKEEKKGVFLL